MRPTKEHTPYFEVMMAANIPEEYDFATLMACDAVPKKHFKDFTPAADKWFSDCAAQTLLVV